MNMNFRSSIATGIRWLVSMLLVAVCARAEDKPVSYYREIVPIFKRS